MELELKKLENLTKKPNADGYGEGLVEPGFTIH